MEPVEALPKVMTPQFAADLPKIENRLRCPHCKTILDYRGAGDTIYFHQGSYDGSANACPNHGKSFKIVAGVVEPYTP